MGSVRLVTLDPALEQAFANDAAYMEALAQGDWARLAEAVRRLVGHTLPALSAGPAELHWGGYLAVDYETQEVIGSCAFKAPPTEEGAVEIAYFTYPGFEGRGYATAMARQLIGLASGSAVVKRVIAHTLPEANPSTHVLEKVGMSFAGEAIDPEDGRVWRWQVRTGA